MNKTIEFVYIKYELEGGGEIFGMHWRGEADLFVLPTKFYRPPWQY